MKREEWQKVDWRLPNKRIAEIHGQKAAWVACMRSKLGVGKATVKNKFNVRPESLKALRDNALPNSEINKSAVRTIVKKWELKHVVKGHHIVGENLRQIIRDNSELFDPDDVRWDGRGKGGGSCPALRRLYYIASDRACCKIWKGWTLEKVKNYKPNNK